jgi:hypothetical protein
MAKYLNRHFLSTLALSTGVGAVSGFVVYSFLESNETEALVKNEVEQRYYKIFENKETKWDSNWDK